MPKMHPTEKVQTCLDFIDQRLETTSEQTIQIAELIINDIKNLTEGYNAAIKNGQLQSHSELVRTTQLKWVNQLHDIILEQTNRDLNGQVIQALKKFTDGLNTEQLQHQDFELPSMVAKEHANEHEYLNQHEINLLLSQQSLFHDTTKH